MSALQPSESFGPASQAMLPRRPAPMGGGARLPRPLTPLIAREQEVATIVSLLRDPGVRLLTLTGPGGVGKTRLSIAAAADVADEFPDGVVFVELSPISDPDLVLATIARSVGLQDMGIESLHERLVTAIAGRCMLLLLDNFEQVVVAAPQLREILDVSPEVSLLVTSRIRLRISGEREFPVAPLLLDTPASDAAGISGAVRLFFERARAVRPDFAPNDETTSAVAEIVRRVDGLPLAIELAAARIKALPPLTLLQRLEQRLPLLSGGARDLPLRQQTMRDTIGWSYDLLNPAEQSLFRRLGIFVGGFTLEAAEMICAIPANAPHAAQPVDPIDVLDGITSLIEHSLLGQHTGPDGEPRYQMLETVAEFARDRLVSSSEHEIMQQRHAAHFLAFAEASEPGIVGPDQAEWLGRLDREKDNLHAALRRAMGQGDVDVATRLGAVLWRFWGRRWHLSEGRSYLAGILELPDDPATRPERCSVLTGASALATLQGDYDQAVQFGEAALTGWRQLGDQLGIGRALLCLSTVARYRDDYAGAEALGAEGLAAFRAVGDRWGAGHILANLGMVAWVQGDHATGSAHYQDALELLREFGDQAGVFDILLELGKGARDAGELARAMPLFEECLALCETTGDLSGRGAVLTELGVIARIEGDYTRATDLLMEATSLARENGDRRQLAWLAAHLGDVDVATGDVTGAAGRYAAALDLYLPMGNRVGIAQSLAAIAQCAVMRGRLVPASRLLGSCAALFKAIGATPPTHRDPDRIAASFKPKINLTEFAEAWNAGVALAPEEAAAEAIALASGLVTETTPVASLEAAAAPAKAADEPSALAATLGLTPREIEVLRLLAEGMSDREIAASLSISERTAGNHVQHAMQKIGVESRTAAAVFAVRHHLA